MGASAPAMNKVAFFRANFNGTTWAIYSALTGTTAATTPAHAGYILTGLIEDGKYDPQEDGTIKASWTQYNDDEAFNDFLNAVVTVANTSGGRPEKTMEDGAKLTSGATSGNYVIMLAYTTTANSKVKTIAAVGDISKTSGSFGTKNEDWTAPTLEFNSIITQAELSLPTGIFDMFHATTNTGGVLAASAVTAAQVIPNKGSFIRKYFDKKI